LKLGVTGGIGCGKSMALECFRELGAQVLSSDSIVRDLLEGNPEVQAGIVEYFGSEVQSADGAIYRTALGDRVFKNAKDLEWLEALLHPRVGASWQEFLELHMDSFVCIEIPLLFEKKLEKHFDFVVCISCSDAIATNRLLVKGYSEETIYLRRRQQLPLASKIAQSDFIIENSSSIEFLKQQCHLLYHRLSALG
tara:strand:- start:8884 stop:9468 length:585 start_codon:yes stop_codon:yes gene_type:complete